MSSNDSVFAALLKKIFVLEKVSCVLLAGRAVKSNDIIQLELEKSLQMVVKSCVSLMMLLRTGE